MDDDTLAYDGSNEPQLRELNARERDILVRLINEELRRISNSESGILRDMRWVLDPRRDTQ